MTRPKIFLRYWSKVWDLIRRYFAGGEPHSEDYQTVQQVISRRRKYEIFVYTVFMCGTAIVAELASLQLLGYKNRVGLQGRFAGMVLMVGISLQVIYLGPTRREIMERLRLRSKEEPPKIDQIYLRFNVSRTIRLVVVVTTMSCLVGLSHILQSREAWIFAAIAVLFDFIAVVRILLIQTRVATGQFGTTEQEARDLIGFLRRLYENWTNPPCPPGSLTLIREETAPGLAPQNAEVAT